MLNNSQRKNDWKLLILTHDNDTGFYTDILSKTEMHFEAKNVSIENNYLVKVNTASSYAEENKFPYVMKCDNDVFLTPNTLDYMIDNLHLLENSKHLTLGPVLTSGIPGIEYFKKSFLDNEAQKQIEQLFLQTNFYDRDGACYQFLNKHTLDSTEWNKTEFFESMRTMNHHYKGSHPIRVNDESLVFLNNYIIANKERFMQNNELSIIDSDNSPYLCNSIFCIKTDTYSNILKDRSLYVDGFDEVPLNKYCWQNNMNHLFVNNGYAIHMYYNWSPSYMEKEREFCRLFF
jgi:hypothetical protein